MVVEEPKTLPVGAISSAKLFTEFEYGGQTIQGQITPDNRFIVTPQGQQIPLDQCRMTKSKLKEDFTQRQYFAPATGSGAAAPAVGFMGLPNMLGGAPPAVNPQLVQLQTALKTKITVTVDGMQHDAEFTNASEPVFIPSLNKSVLLKSHKSPGGYEWKIQVKK